MKYAIDRIENHLAVLQDDDGGSHNVDITLLPSDASVGDVLLYKNGRYEHDREETRLRRERIHRLEQRLRGKKKG